MSRLDAIKASVLAQPFHRACELNLIKAEGGESETTFALNDFTLSPAGTLHGGILYALMDVTCFLAVMPQLGEQQHAVTIETHTSLLRAARHGDTVVIRGQVDRLGRTLAAMRAQAYARKPDGEEKLIATGSVTKTLINP